MNAGLSAKEEAEYDTTDLLMVATKENKLRDRLLHRNFTHMTMGARE